MKHCTNTGLPITEVNPDFDRTERVVRFKKPIELCKEPVKMVGKFAVTTDAVQAIADAIGVKVDVITDSFFTIDEITWALNQAPNAGSELIMPIPIVWSDYDRTFSCVVTSSVDGDTRHFYATLCEQVHFQ